MKKLLLILFLAALTGNAYGFGKDAQGCGNDCKGCHKVTKTEAANILKGIDPSLAVEDVSPSPIRGLHQIIVKKGGKDLILYMDFSKNFVVSGSIIDLKEKKDLTREAVEERQTVDVSKINVENALVMGNKNGSKKLYVFSDPECPFCLKLHDELTLLVKDDPQVTVYIILYGLDMHPNAGWKSNSILCRSKENMADALRMLDDSYHKKDIKRITCGKDYNESNKKIAAGFGITGTPTMVLPNGKMVVGARKKDELKKMLTTH